LKLNQKIVDAIGPGPRQILWDDACPGFGVRVTEGAVAYLVIFRVAGRKRWHTIEATNRLRYAGALARAREITAAAKTGRDITVNPRDGMPTFAQVWRQMIDEVDKPKLSPATIADYEDRARRLILPKIGRKLIGDVTEADVDKIISATTGERNRAYVATLIKKVVNHAKRARILPGDFRNPAQDIRVKKPTTKVARALETEEIAAFGKALADMEAEGHVSPWLANLLRLSLICGLRPGECRTLKWFAVQ